MIDPLRPLPVAIATLLSVLPGPAPAPQGKAGKIPFDKMLNTKLVAKSLSDLSGSAVLVEFWATW